VRILALDFGSARTGVAVCDPTETIVRPCGVVRHAGAPEGLAKIVEMVRAQAAELVVVGVPVSLRGGEHGQARTARAFAAALTQAVAVPVDTYDERYTTKLAVERGGRAELDARAAAVLLEDYLRVRAAGGRR
jgi:putative holliday junction resolvase